MTKRKRKNRICTFEDCGNKHHAKGYCHAHYLQLRAGETLRPLRQPREGCSFASCPKSHHARGLCVGHHEQKRKRHSLRPLNAKRPRSVDPLEWIGEQLTTTEENPTCWTWTGSTNGRYGRVSVPDRDGLPFVHRYIWERLVGELDGGREVDHLCQNKLCANPAHLQAIAGADHRKITVSRARELKRASALFPRLDLEWYAVDRSLPTMRALDFAMTHGLPFYAMEGWRSTRDAEGIRTE